MSIRSTPNVNTTSSLNLASTGEEQLVTSAQTVSAGQAFVAYDTAILTSLQVPTKASLSGDSFTGDVYFTALSGESLSATTIFSGGTSLETVIGNYVASLPPSGYFYDFTTTGLITPTLTGDTNGNLLIQGNNGVNPNTLAGGSGNTVVSGLGNAMTSSNFSGVFVGASNNVTSGGSSVILGGTVNSINGSSVGAIFGGSNHTLTNGSYGTVMGGLNNVVTNGTSSGMFSAEYSEVNNSNRSVIIGGTNNLLSGTSNSAIIACTSVSAYTSNTVYVPDLRVQGKIYSGNTDISSFFTPSTDYTAQLATKANLSGASFTGVINSGGTDLSNLFTSQSSFNTLNSLTTLQTAQLLTKANLSGSTFTGTVIAPTLSATTLSASTIMSGSTNLSSVFEPRRLRNFSVADQTVNATTTALISGSTIVVPTTGIKVGTLYTFTTTLSKTNAGTASNEFQVRLGTTNSVSDAVILRFQTGLGTGAFDTGRTEISVLVRGPVGGSCIAVGSMRLTHSLASTGLSTVPSITARMTSAAFSSTTPSIYFNVSVTTAASTVFTFYDTTVETVNL